MGWRIARSLETLRAQVNAAHPARSKASDGTIGDAAHAATVSDHNPDRAGVVRALDLTNDPAHGFSAAALAETLRLSRDPRIKYVISNRRIFSATISPWTWRPYSGTDPHTSHVHVSVVPDGRADDTSPWTITQEEDMPLTDDDAKKIWRSDIIPSPDKEADNPTWQADSYLRETYRAVRSLRALVASQSPAAIAAAVKAALPTAGPTVDVDQLARAIVIELGKDS